MDTCYKIETFKIRLAAAEPVDGARTRCPKESVAIARPIFADLDADQEHFVVLLLNNKHKIKAFKVVSSGSLTASLVHPREAFRPVMLYGAAAVVFVHNHPSGDPAPSPEDTDLTHRLVEVAEVIGVRVLDHIVLGRDSYFSFSDRGMLHGPSLSGSGSNRSAPPTPAAPALRPDGKRRRGDFGRPRGPYKDRTAKRKDAGVPRGPRTQRAATAASQPTSANVAEASR